MLYNPYYLVVVSQLSSAPRSLYISENGGAIEGLSCFAFNAIRLGVPYLSQLSMLELCSLTARDLTDEYK
jgi:hypothetical protein